MTRERAKELLPIITAFAEGKRVECLFGTGSWLKVEDPDWAGRFVYRIAPEPNIRPWNVDEVPHLARIREKGPTTKQSFYSTILAVKNDCEVMCLNGWYTTGYLLDHCEHSTDGGKTWLPCGVVEGEK